MIDQSFSITLTVDKSPLEVFNAIGNVRGWWSEEIVGETTRLNDRFIYQYRDVHRAEIQVTDVIPGEKIVWQVLNNFFSFTKDKTEWIGTRIIFEIRKKDGSTELHFTHLGLIPDNECYTACVSGWNQYIQTSLQNLINTGSGQPNRNEKAITIHELVLRYAELARQEKWFEIQDELFSDDIISIEPADSPWFQNAEGRSAVRQKGEDWVKRITGVHRTSTTEPVVGGDFFAVGREVEITVQDLGNVQINQVMVYEVKNGKIVTEQFFY